MIAERKECGKGQKADNLINVDIGLAQDSVDTVFEFVEGKVDNYYTETTITGNSNSEEEVQIQNIMVDSHDELELLEPEHIPHAVIRFAGAQILEEFMLEEEIEFQGIDECKIVELPDEQEINECAVSELVGNADLLVRFIKEQETEDSIKEEASNIFLTKMYRADESVHKDKIMLETPKTNAVAISELPREVKLEMPIEQSETKLVQDVNLVSDVPTPFHAVPNRNILGKSISKLHTRQRKILGSKLVRRVNPTRLVKRKNTSMCRLPPEPSDRQNGLNDKASKTVFPDIYYANEERVNYRPPPKPPYILNINGEVIGIIEKENLLYTEPNYRPPPNPTKNL